MDMQSADTRLLYVYCIAPANEVGSVAEAFIRGIDGEPCERVQFRNLSVILSRLDEKLYNEQAIEAKLTDTEWVARNATNHHEVIASVYTQSPVLPLPFCTLFSTLEKLHEVMDERYKEITETFAFFTEKEVWNLKLYCRKGAIREVLTKAQLHAENIDSLPPGKQYLLKKKINQMIDAKVEQEQDEFAVLLHEQLEGMASSVYIQKCWKETEDAEGTMVFNCSYLVSISQLESFSDKISAFKDQYIKGDEWRIALSGPWPPYHFAKLPHGA